MRHREYGRRNGRVHGGHIESPVLWSSGFVMKSRVRVEEWVFGYNMRGSKNVDEFGSLGILVNSVGESDLEIVPRRRANQPVVLIRSAGREYRPPCTRRACFGKRHVFGSRVHCDLLSPSQLESEFVGYHNELALRWYWSAVWFLK